MWLCPTNNNVFVCHDVNISIWLMSQCPVNYRACPVFCWSILISSLWSFLPLHFACGVLFCPLLYWLWIVVVFHYILSPYFLLALSPLTLYLSSSFSFYLFVHYCLFCKFVYKFVQLVVYMLLLAFHYLIPEVIFWGYGGDCPMSLGLHHSDLVTSPIVGFWPMPDYCSVSPAFAALYHCSWSCM